MVMTGMNLTNIYSSLSLIQPEIAISLTLVVVLLFDLIFPLKKSYLPWISLAGIIVSGWLLINGAGSEAFAFLVSGHAMISIDPAGFFFKVVILLSTALIILFTVSSSEVNELPERLGEYYTLILGMALGMMFMASGSDLVSIYLSIEILSLSSYVLAGHIKLRERNSEAALKYIIYGGASSGIMLFGISILYGLTGTTNLFEINKILQTVSINQFTLSVSLLFIFTGIGYKISAVPFHFWTPDVYEGAPVSITAYLSVASKAAGFILLVRVVKTGFVNFTDSQGYWHLVSGFDWQTLLIGISLLTMTLGNLTALWQKNVKRMLAYSSIAHAGYMLLGVAVLSNQGITALMIYFIVYMMMNIGAFYVVLLIANKTGSEEVSDYDGLGYTSPFLGIALTIFLISLTGLPPTAGFIGKLYLFIALLDAKMITVALIALLNTVISLYYYIRVLKHMFLVKPGETTPSIPFSTGNMVYLLILLIPLLIFGIWFSPIVEFAESCITIAGSL